MPLGVDKGNGIRRLGEHYGIEIKNIMAIGDSQNDLDMLKAAGFLWPWTNAAQEVKDAADYVTLSNDEEA